MGNSSAVLNPWVDEYAWSKRNETYPGSGQKQMLRYYLENWTVPWILWLRLMTASQWHHHQKQAMRIAKNSLANEDESASENPLCFLSLGSEGREEQLLRTDQDNALVYEDVPWSLTEEAHAYFLKLWHGNGRKYSLLWLCFLPSDTSLASKSKWYNRWANEEAISRRMDSSDQNRGGDS